MNTDFETTLNYVVVCLDRVGEWFLMDRPLASFVCSGEFDDITVGILGITPEEFLLKGDTYGFKGIIHGDEVRFRRDGKEIIVKTFKPHRKNTVISNGTVLNLDWIKTPEDERDSIRAKHSELRDNGMWRRQISETSPLSVSLPYYYGTVLDNTLPGWYNCPKRPYPKNGDVFYDKKRKENGYILIEKLHEAARASGFGDKIFCGFGTCLGFLMYGDFIPKDRDIDHCILADDLTVDQHKKYAALAEAVDEKKPSRWAFSKNGEKYLWLSVGYKNPESENGVKSCNWFMYRWNGYLFHSKGGLWVNPRKINQKIVQYNMKDAAIGLGQPNETITGATEVQFGKIKMNIPDKPGSCCDHWYPGWSPKGSGASAHRVVMVVGDWKEESTWRLI